MRRPRHAHARPALRAAAALAALAAAACGPAGAYVPPGFTPDEAAWEEQHAAERAGRLAAAAEGYRALCEREPSYPRACYDRARLLFELDRVDEARAETERFVLAHPAHALAPAAITRLARSYADAGAARAGAEALDALRARVAGAEVWDTISYEMAGLLGAAGDAAAEAAALGDVVDRGRWGSQLWDDALWRLVAIAEASGDAAQEQRLLERLLAAREESKLIGSYASKYHDDALLRLGRLHLDAGRLDRAFDLFLQLARWETSRSRDEGYYWAAVVRARQGRRAEACELLGVVAREMPESSAAGEAAALRAEIGCR